MNSKPEFGFEGLDSFKPRGKPKPKSSGRADDSVEIRQVDQVAKELGFSSREPQVERRKKKGVNKPTDQFNLRAHISDINKFVEHAEKTSRSYREVFEELVAKLK